MTEPVKVPVPRPYTRVPIKPAVRHKDKRRQEKHKKPITPDDSAEERD